MSDSTWYAVAETDVEVRLPAGWVGEADAEEGGSAVFHPDGEGELHLVGFPLPPGEVPDPGEELFAFLAEHDIELEEDDLDDVELTEGDLALCEYISEDEESGDADFWLVGVAAVRGTLVFAQYICEAGREEAEAARVREILGTLRPRAAG